MNENTQATNNGLSEALEKYAAMIARNELFLNEKIGLTERERRFAVDVISKAVYELKQYARREKMTAEFENIDEYYKDRPDHNRDIGYGYGQRNAARDIAGSSLSSLFGGMGADTINALESLSKREDIHTFCPVIVEEYYCELEEQWKR
ncbi:MAG: hypothetical protein LBU77_00025 [Clostridiales bacterium]|nr:hypothetical protein [Clostridiales bacterium]